MGEVLDVTGGQPGAPLAAIRVAPCYPTWYAAAQLLAGKTPTDMAGAAAALEAATATALAADDAARYATTGVSIPGQPGFNTALVRCALSTFAPLAERLTDARHNPFAPPQRARLHLPGSIGDAFHFLYSAMANGVIMLSLNEEVVSLLRALPLTQRAFFPALKKPQPAAAAAGSGGGGGGSGGGGAKAAPAKAAPAKAPQKGAPAKVAAKAAPAGATAPAAAPAGALQSLHAKPGMALPAMLHWPSLVARPDVRCAQGERCYYCSQTADGGCPDVGNCKRNRGVPTYELPPPPYTLREAHAFVAAQLQ